ncbi:type VI secretion system Hcp family effector [Buttiauxella sp. BIGb0471]|uniref:Hcp family type VI secretion system effector n=1 Tax=Buttiauxella sp. BIGb0471 TaxID=2940597 RepID=UPI0021678FC7|nr:Hcp family type VI secretion system effector [Buttiauxella sp. BIGb0471]MCS3603950.1 type VI secretion system Hcp family effector [Buttiauxella sp. BIGb0471]
MANLIYLTLTGLQQGLMSAGCCSLDSIGNKAQIAHLDQIMVYGFSHSITRVENAVHHPVIITKPVDKSTPLLGKAISENEILNCDFDTYRINRFGINELYLKIKLTKARITDYHLVLPNNLLDNKEQPQEAISLSYETITWENVPAGTSAYSLWNDRVL